jgi:hypothetical protein
MALLQDEALAAARKLVRTFASAPDPRARARLVHTTLLQMADWPAPLRVRIDGFGDWLGSSPPAGELRARCVNLVETLGASGPVVESNSQSPRR